MPAAARADQSIFLAANLDDLFMHLQLLPAVDRPDLLRVVRVDAFAVEVHVIVHQHGQAPGVMTRLAQQRKRDTGEKVAIDFAVGCADVRFVPYRRRGKADVRVVGQQRRATCAAPGVDYPGVGAEELAYRQGLFNLADLLEHWRQQFDVGLSGRAHRRQLVWPAGY